MSVRFDLDDLHSSYGRVVVDTLRGLNADYPYGALHRVSVYQGADNDFSIANANQPGEIALNSYWFSRPIEVLREAARERPIIRIAPNQTIYWHGATEEPQHVLAHEFAHCLQDVFRGWRDWTETHWLASCRDPVACRPVSGYALAGPDEFWADTFAALRNNVDCEIVRLMRDFLAGGQR